MKINYQLKCDEEINALNGRVPSLLLHSCCGPCSSYVLEYLSKYFSVTVLYYNPNIYPDAEYYKRLENQRRVIELLPAQNKVSIMECVYDPERYEEYIRGMENEREGGARCTLCFRLRMGETARLAKENGFEYFTTTLSVSPHKNSQLLNALGEELEKQHGVKYLYADFKKREGYKRSIELSREYGLYRQNYCGCRYSLRDNPEAVTPEQGT